MIIRTIPVGSMQANCYILECKDSDSAVIIDPGGDADMLLDYIDKQNLAVKFIVNTHSHIDHIAGNSELKAVLPTAPLCIHESGVDRLTDSKLNLSAFLGIPYSSPVPEKILHDEDILEAGCIHLKVIHTPGHSPDSICLLSEECIFTGDLLFAGSIGRYDFPGSSYETLMKSLEEIIELDGSLTVYPGHGPKTSIDEERRSNPFLV
ncbi:MBL fold metallo-hydrolase [Candidatus Poribacteria bacterium]|nr:MBL fold metallo-hydrolase [Candidatus Poribacteria bacterium]